MIAEPRKRESAFRTIVAWTITAAIVAACVFAARTGNDALVLILFVGVRGLAQALMWALGAEDDKDSGPSSLAPQR